MHKKIKIGNSIELTPLAEKHHAQLWDLMNEIYLPVYKHIWNDEGTWYVNSIYNIKNFQEELSNPKAFYYFVNYHSETIGILRIIQDFKVIVGEKSINCCKLHRIYLHPKVHGKKIGKALMEWTFQRAEKAGINKVYLEAMDTQTQALKVYKKLGFKVFGQFELESPLAIAKFKGLVKMILEI